MATETELHPVTFEVLKNAFINTVDQMAEQVLRTCYSFVIYNRDFSSALHDAEGNTIAQGNYDIAVHVGTLHYSCMDVIRVFGGKMREGDVFIVNDPYSGGTHFNDVRLVRPVFADGEVIGYAQSNGHWADIGGSVPGSFDVMAKEMFKEGLRITPMRIVEQGELRRDIANMLAGNTRDPAAIIGDMEAQIEATRVGEREILRLVAKYGKDVVKAGMAAVQDYVERAMRQRLAALPDGTWESVDFIDQDPDDGEGLIPIRSKVTIKGDSIVYDLTGSHGVIGTLYNSAFGATFSGIVGGLKTFFPDLPLNSGFYRAIKMVAPENSIVSAEWPVAVTGFLMVYEKIMNGAFEIFSKIMPERAMAGTFNIEYLLTGGRNKRTDSLFMLYDWLPGGWGARNGRDGAGPITACFGTGLQAQPVEGQERANPILTERFEILTDSAGPGRHRGGMATIKSSRLTKCEKGVISYICDRERAIVFGIEGGLPSMPHGLTLRRKKDGTDTWMGAIFSDVPIAEGDWFSRPTAGGGGYGDPLERDPEAVKEDVADDLVSIRRAGMDYGVVIETVDADLAEYKVDYPGTEKLRQELRGQRRGWLKLDPEEVSRLYKAGEIDAMDCCRRYAVVLEWETGNLLPKSTAQFREMVNIRSAAYWSDTAAPAEAAAE